MRALLAAVWVLGLAGSAVVPVNLKAPMVADAPSMTQPVAKKKKDKKGPHCFDRCFAKGNHPRKCDKACR